MTLLTPTLLLLVPLALWLLPYLRRSSLRPIPGPALARLSNLWLLYHARLARRSLAVHAAHGAHGPLVRIQPNHVSVADDAAIPAIYGHGTGTLKPDFYDAFVSIHRGLFNTRDRAQHARKRRLVAHSFSKSSIRDFEPYIRAHLVTWVAQWDRLSDEVGGGYASIDALHWFNYLAFDIIGDLAFGAPFGMLARGADVAEVRDTPDGAPRTAPAIQVLNRRGEVSAAVGCWPALKPWAKYLPDPFFSNGIRAVEALAGIAVASVRARMLAPEADGPERTDLLARLMQGKDDTGAPLGRDELTAEALTQLIAGSDTTSNTSCALLYWLLRTPHVLPKLRAELDAAIPAGTRVPAHDDVQACVYLGHVINETLRIHSTSSMGLPREVPPGPGVVLHGHHFPPGTVLSVPAYTIHHSRAIWGDDAAAFRPERWEALTPRQRDAFIPFSTGPRACVGRNVAEMELRLIVATMVRNFDVRLEQEEEMATREGFLRKPVGLRVGTRQRQGVGG